LSTTGNNDDHPESDEDFSERLDELLESTRPVLLTPQPKEELHPIIESKPLPDWPFHIATLIVIAFIFVGFYNIDRISIDQQENPVGIVNTLREIVFPSHFWEEQERLIENKIADLEDQPRQDAEEERLNRELDRQLKQDSEKYYLEHPEERPSVAEQKAQALRDKADEIENIEVKAFLEKSRLEDLAEYRRMLDFVRRKIMK